MASCQRERPCPWKIGGENSDRAYGEAQANLRPQWYVYLTLCLGIWKHDCRIVDCGDYVVVTNASQVKVTGRKADQILYRKHTLYPGGLKEIKYRDMMSKKPDEVRHSLVSLKCHLLTRQTPRSSEKRSRACCQKIDFVTDDWRGYGYLRVRTWAFSRKTFSSDGRMGPSMAPRLDETILRFSKFVDYFTDLLTRYLDPSI